MIGFELNIIEVAVAAVVSIIIGMAWYSPLLFGNLWLKLSGKSKKDMDKSRKEMPKLTIAQLIASAVTAFVLSNVLKAVGSASVQSAVATSIVLWLGFVAAETAGNVLWEGQPTKLYFLKNAGSLVTLAAMAVVITLV